LPGPIPAAALATVSLNGDVSEGGMVRVTSLLTPAGALAESGPKAGWMV
jgi:hypothetical protein